MIPQFTERLSDLVDGVDVILSDIWGVVHNGVEQWTDACGALATFRKRGGTVVLITNAPRPHDAVERMLQRLAIKPDVYDAIVSSGDQTRAYVSDHRAQSLYHIGPERDGSLFRDFDVTFESVERAEGPASVEVRQQICHEGPNPTEGDARAIEPNAARMGA